MAVRACKARFRASRLRADSFTNASLERVLALVALLDDFVARSLRRFPLFGLVICFPFSTAVSHGVLGESGER